MRLAGRACTVGAERWGQVLIESDDPIRRRMAAAVIVAAIDADQERQESFAQTLFGGG